MSEEDDMLNFVISARIYDVLIGIYTHLDPAAASRLMQAHQAGALLGPEPRFNGEFITEEVNPLPPE